MGPSVTGVTGGCRRAWPLLLSAPCPNAPSGWSARWRVPRRSSAACECVAQTRHSRRRGGTSGGRLFARPRFAGASGWPVGYIAGSRGPEVAGPSWAAARAERPGDTGRPGRPAGGPGWGGVGASGLGRRRRRPCSYLLCGSRCSANPAASRPGRVALETGRGAFWDGRPAGVRAGGRGREARARAHLGPSRRASGGWRRPWGDVRRARGRL